MAKQAPSDTRRSQDESSQRDAERTAPTENSAPATRRTVDLIVSAGMAILLAIVFGSTLHPGVERGDSAEMQYISVIGGVCHPPGYPIMVLAGRAFQWLPLGSPAWRINLMMACCGVAGALLMLAAVRRITGSNAAGIVAAGTLAFSTVYWQHAVLAEVYVFFGLFLIAGLYFGIRFFQSNQIGWLIAAGLALGICVGSRISEISVLPAFVVAWWAFRKSAPITVARLGVCAPLLIAPFVFNLVYYLTHEDSARLHARDDALRDGILAKAPDFASLSFGDKLKEGLLYVTGLKWSDRAEFSGEKLIEDIGKLGWRISGLGAFGERYRTDRPAGETKNMLQGPGTSVGLLGVILALVGIWLWRRRLGWPTLGGLFFLGNTAFYFYHNAAPDNLDFTLPGVIGLALLAGLGTTGPESPSTRSGWKRFARPALCMLAPLFLLTTNYARLDRSGKFDQEWIRNCADAAKAPIEPNAAVIARYDSANMFRYIYWVAADPPRRDVSVIIYRARWMPDELVQLVEGLRVQGRPVYLTQDMWSFASLARIPVFRPNDELARFGFGRVAGP